MFQVLDHGVEPAGDNIVLIALIVSGVILALATVSYIWWRRRHAE